MLVLLHISFEIFLPNRCCMHCCVPTYCAALASWSSRYNSYCIQF